MTTIQNPSIPLNPPREWFTPPAEMAKDTGCVVEPDGRIYGYICHWDSVLMDGSNDRWTPPRSKTNYDYAHTGDTECSDGSMIKTANLGGDAGHAKVDPLDPNRLQNLQAFYENTSTQLARVVYGEDSIGVWFAGACWPTITDLEIAKLRASARSGHWVAMPHWRGYELVGACLVNIPGLKYARVDRVASDVFMISPMGARDTNTRIAEALTEVLKLVGGSMTITDNAQLGATSYADLVIHDDRTAQWDSAAAEGRVREWADAQDAPNDQYAKGFLYVDSAAPELFGSYKLGFADVFNGELHAVPRGVFAVAGVLQGARGGIEGVSDADITAIKASVTKYYEKMATVFNDPTIIAPWDQTGMSVDKIASSGTIQLEVTSGDAIPVSGVLVVENQLTEDGRFIESGAITWRDTPLPLYAKLENTSGHDDAQLVGRIDSISRSIEDANTILYTATILPLSADGYGQQVVQAIHDDMLRGVSIDGICGPNDYTIDENEVMRMSGLVIGGATLTPMPAINEATVTIGLSEAGGVSMQSEDNTDIEAATGDVPVDVAVDNTATPDQIVALSDAVDSIAARIDYLIGLVEQSQMSARLSALKLRESE